MTTTRRSRTITKVASAGAGLGLAVVAVLGFSNAAFSAQADPNVDNNWATDQAVTLNVDDSVTAPLFSFGLNGVGRPQSGGVLLADWDGYLTDTPAELNAEGGVRTIEVTYDGNVAAEIRMYATQGNATSAVSGPAAATDITISVAGEGVVYTGPLGALGNTWGTSGASFTLPANTSPQARVVSVTLTQAGMDDASTVEGVQFHWEAQRPS